MTKHYTINQTAGFRCGAGRALLGEAFAAILIQLMQTYATDAEGLGSIDSKTFFGHNITSLTDCFRSSAGKMREGKTIKRISRKE